MPLPARKQAPAPAKLRPVPKRAGQGQLSQEEKAALFDQLTGVWQGLDELELKRQILKSRELEIRQKARKIGGSYLEACSNCGFPHAPGPC